ncbi:MAG: SDR family NAD(P)-dependent oxidoreductase, partial [Peptoniphilus harei]|nr:SDR family NAD(P)-dependent oxidoreductase [Peptoniphilus harei]
MRFESKVLVITGASSGVGRAASLMAAEEGAKVYSFARRKEKLEALAEEAKSLGYK